MMSFSEQADSPHNAPGPSKQFLIYDFFFVTGVTIGFEEETVQILENIRMKTLCLNVSLGQLLRTTTVNVSYQDQTAISNFIV